MVKRYITEMGITDNFYQQMVNAEPAKMVVYTDKDVERIVPTVDPTYQEIEISYEARRYGVTTSEMRRRLQDMWNCSKVDFPNNANCIQPAVWGLSERVYVEREKKDRTECWFQEHEMQSDKDVETLFAIPRKARRDHPLTIQLETCERNIMLGR
jgi:hypothetical protein